VREDLFNLLDTQIEHFRARIAAENLALLEKWEDAREAYATGDTDDAHP
jgi:hypothetical protein